MEVIKRVQPSQQCRSLTQVTAGAHLAAVAVAGGLISLAAIILPEARRNLAAIILHCWCLGSICVAAGGRNLAAAICHEADRIAGDCCAGLAGVAIRAYMFLIGTCLFLQA